MLSDIALNFVILGSHHKMLIQIVMQPLTPFGQQSSNNGILSVNFFLAGIDRPGLNTMHYSL